MLMIFPLSFLEFSRYINTEAINITSNRFNFNRA